MSVMTGFNKTLKKALCFAKLIDWGFRRYFAELSQIDTVGNSAFCHFNTPKIFMDKVIENLNLLTNFLFKISYHKRPTLK